MRFEGHGPKGCPKAVRLPPDNVEDSLMAQMDAVEIPDGGRGTAVSLRDEFGISDDSHAPELASGVEARKRG